MRILLLALAAALGMTACAPAQEPANRAEIEQIVRDYILTNPEIIQ